MKDFIFDLQRFDTITNDKTNKVITGGNDSDSINNSGNFVKISLGGGSDSIYNTGNLVTISAGGGENRIDNSGEDAYIVTGNSTDSINNEGANSTIQVGDGNDSVRNWYANNVLINLGDGNNYTDNIGYYPSGGRGEYVTITAGAGDDSIYNEYGNYAKISTGDGNDSVNNYGSDVFIETGNGNDTVHNSYGASVTINTGAGDDYIGLADDWRTSAHVIYNYGDGDNTITNFNSNDTLQIATGGHEFTTMKSGNDMYIIFDNGSITLQNVGSDISLSNFVITGGNSGGGTTSTPEPEPEPEPEPVDSSGTGTPTLAGGTDDTSTGGTDTPTVSGGDDPTVTTAGGGGDTYITIEPGGIYAPGGTVNVTNTTVVGVTVVNNTMTFTNEYNTNILNLVGNENYSNVINIDGSTATGAKYFIGNANSNSIKAGSGGSTLWGGGAGNNTLVGGSGKDYFQYSGGYDVIKNFTTGKSSNSDVLYFSSVGLTSLRRESNYLELNATDGTSLELHTSSSVDEAIGYTTDGTNVSYAKIGKANASNSFVYQDGVNYYAGGDSTDVLKITDYQASTNTSSSTPTTVAGEIVYNMAAVTAVDNSTNIFSGVGLANSKSKNIWLDGSISRELFGVDTGIVYSEINDIDASSSTGDNTLAGNSDSNQITAGSGNDSLWGASGDDTLIGGTGENNFFFGKGDGADVLKNAKQGDTINLYDVTLADILSANISGNVITANLTSGAQLQINSADNLSAVIKLVDGNYQYNHSSGRWQEA